MADTAVRLRPINLAVVRMAAHLGLPAQPTPTSHGTIPELGLASERLSNAPESPGAPDVGRRAVHPDKGESR